MDNSPGTRSPARRRTQTHHTRLRLTAHKETSKALFNGCSVASPCRAGVPFGHPTMRQCLRASRSHCPPLRGGSDSNRPRAVCDGGTGLARRRFLLFVAGSKRHQEAERNHGKAARRVFLMRFERSRLEQEKQRTGRLKPSPASLRIPARRPPPRPRCFLTELFSFSYAAQGQRELVRGAGRFSSFGGDAF